MKHGQITTLSIGGLLLATALGTAGAGLVTSSAKAAEVEGPKVHWLASAWGTRRGFTESLEGLVKYVSDKTDGNFTIEIKYGEALSPTKENLDGIQVGAFEVAQSCAVYHPGKTPALTGLDLAFLPIFSLEQRAKVHEAYFKNPVVQSEMEKWNAKFLVSAIMPAYEVMGKGKAPEKVEDWKGMKLQAAGGIGAVMRELGATTVTLPSVELFQSMERGVIDGAAQPFTYSFASYQLDTLADWMTTNLALGSPACVTVMNKDAYAKLPDQYKKLLEDAKWPAYEHQIAKYTETDEKNLKKFKEEGLKEIQIDEDVRNQIIKTAAKKSWDEWVKARNDEGLDGQALLDAILAAARDARSSN
ncbi:MAG: TRAP transporter substrate-binding protein DctP [Rhodobiaceae bacterium]|nr:TRAP transporter substrate-binding protein DctP [Rhodobiaceae bacterium]MCC0054749.1 TRAP transporter substrate-binding protein DctP [Rhodobiaceae bacterium]